MPQAEQLTRGTTYTSSIHRAQIFVSVDGFFSLDDDEVEIALRIARLTPTNDDLRRLATNRQSMDRRFNEDQEFPW